MERRHIEHSPIIPCAYFPAGIVIIQISTRPELGGLRESGFRLVNRKIRHKARGKILFSHKKEKAQVGVVGFTRWPGENGRDIRGIRTYLELGRTAPVLRPSFDHSYRSSQYSTSSTLCTRFLSSNNIPPALVDFHASGGDLAIG